MVVARARPNPHRRELAGRALNPATVDVSLLPTPPKPASPLWDSAGLWLERRPPAPIYFPSGLLFEAQPIKRPLTPLSGKSGQKLAAKASKLILKYGAPSKKPRAPFAKKLIELALDNRGMDDEIYCQLVKQTTNNTDRECLVHTMELFLVVATCIPASPPAAPDIKLHLAQHAHAKDLRLADLGQLSFIRFSDRCAIGEPITHPKTAFLASIPTDINSTTVTVGRSIAEHLWAQRNERPTLRVPFVFHALAAAIMEKGAESTEGIFRRCGNAVRVQEMITTINRGAALHAMFARADIHDLTHLLSQMLVNLPVCIVPSDRVGALMSVYETSKDYIRFLAELPLAHVETLRFLCAYLKRLGDAEAQTKMSLSNLAIVLGPTLVGSGPRTDQFDAVRHTVVSQEFILTLLRNWDVRLPDDFCSQ
jgi:hypothetical protein